MSTKFSLAALLLLTACFKPENPPTFQPKPGVDYVTRQVVALVDLTENDLKPGQTLTGVMSKAGENVGLTLKKWFYLPGQGKYACGKIFATYETKVASDSVFDKAKNLEDSDSLFQVNPNLIAVYAEKSQPIVAPVDPLWALKAINKPNYVQAEGVRIAVIDTGLSPYIPINSADPKNTTVEPNTDYVTDGFADPDWGLPPAGHGTGVSSIVSGYPFNSGQGIPVGVANHAVIVPIKAADDSGYATLTSVTQAVCYAVSQNARVINMSLGSTVPSSILEDAIRDANLAGTLVVASAGNSNQNPDPLRRNRPQYPAAYAEKLPNVIAVGAVDEALKAAGFSNRNKYIDIVAPGVKVFAHSAATEPEHPQIYYPSGTSFAAPYVSGVAAVLYVMAQQGAYAIKPSEIKEIIKDTARDISSSCTDKLACGVGLLDMQEAMHELESKIVNPQ